MAIVDGNPVNASYTNQRVMSKQNDNSIAGLITTAKYFASQFVDVATAATINSLSAASGWVRLTGSTATALNGITGGANGRFLTIYNVSSATVTVANLSGSATGSEQIITPTGSSVPIASGNSLALIYDSTQSKWIVVNTSVSGFSNPMNAIGQLIYGGASGVATALAIGAADQILQSNAGAAPTWVNKYLTTTFYDEKTAGADGGTFTSGAWRTRELNQQSGNTTFASLSANRMTINAGSYIVNTRAQAYEVNSHQTIFYNITDASTLLTGTQAYSGSGDATTSESFIVNTFTINAQKVFELQHQCSTTKASQGFGVGSGFAAGIYATVQLTKIA